MAGHRTGTDIAAGFGQNQIIAAPAVPLTLKRPAALRRPRRQVSAGAVLVT